MKNRSRYQHLKYASSHRQPYIYFMNESRCPGSPFSGSIGVMITYPQLFCCVMMTSSNGNIFRVTGHLCEEFTGPGEFSAQRPVTGSFNVFFDLNKRLSKQSWGWWFETLLCPLWRHCNVDITLINTSAPDRPRVANSGGAASKYGSATTPREAPR